MLKSPPFSNIKHNKKWNAVCWWTLHLSVHRKLNYLPFGLAVYYSVSSEKINGLVMRSIRRILAFCLNFDLWYWPYPEIFWRSAVASSARKQQQFSFKTHPCLNCRVDATIHVIISNQCFSSTEDRFCDVDVYDDVIGHIRRRKRRER
mgnify:CR=1 FL=1